MTTARELLEAREAEARARRVQRTWPPALGGRSSLVSPMRPGRVAGGVQQAPITVESLDPPAGQLLTMSASGASIASGGDHVTFGSILARTGFDGAVAGESWTHPISGVYGLAYEHEWGSYEGGGTVAVEIDDEVSDDRLIGSGVGAEGRGTIFYYADAGSVGKIKVTHDDASAQSCDAVVRVAVTDPASGVVSSPAISAPASLASVGTDDQNNGPITLTHGAPSGTQVGDLMVMSWTGYSLSTSHGIDGSQTPDPAWTLVSDRTWGNPEVRVFVRIYSKVADADDAAGTASYDWKTTGGANYMALLCATIPQANGTTLGVVSAQHQRDEADFSIPAPSGGDWVLVFFAAKETRSTASVNCTPTVTTAEAVELASNVTPSGLRGRHRMYAVSSSVSTIAGSLAPSNNPFGALVGVAVTA